MTIPARGKFDVLEFGRLRFGAMASQTLFGRNRRVVILIDGEERRADGIGGDSPADDDEDDNEDEPEHVEFVRARRHGGAA